MYAKYVVNSTPDQFFIWLREHTSEEFYSGALKFEHELGPVHLQPVTVKSAADPHSKVTRLCMHGHQFIGTDDESITASGGLFGDEYIDFKLVPLNERSTELTVKCGRPLLEDYCRGLITTICQRYPQQVSGIVDEVQQATRIETQSQLSKRENNLVREPKISDIHQDHLPMRTSRVRLSPRAVADAIEQEIFTLGYEIARREQTVGGSWRYIINHEGHELGRISVSPKDSGRYFETSMPQEVGIGIAYSSERSNGFKQVDELRNRFTNLIRAISERLEQEIEFKTSRAEHGFSMVEQQSQWSLEIQNWIDQTTDSDKVTSPIPWEVNVSLPLEDVDAACYEHLERVAGKRFPAELEVNVTRYIEKENVALRFDIGSGRRAAGHVRIRRISAQQTLMEITPNFYGNDNDAARLREIVSIFFGRWLADLQSHPTPTAGGLPRSPRIIVDPKDLVLVNLNSTAGGLKPGSYIVPSQLAGSMQLADAAIGNMKDQLGVPYVMRPMSQPKGELALKHKPAGRPPDPENAEAFRIIADGDGSDEAYAAAYVYWCEAKEIAEPGKHERNAFKKAMQRAEERYYLQSKQGTK